MVENEMNSSIESFNLTLELIARLIEAVTGDKVAAKIVRDAKLPVREIRYVAEEKEEPVTQHPKAQ